MTNPLTVFQSRVFLSLVLFLHVCMCCTSANESEHGQAWTCVCAQPRTLRSSVCDSGKFQAKLVAMREFINCAEFIVLLFSSGWVRKFCRKWKNTHTLYLTHPMHWKRKGINREKEHGPREQQQRGAREIHYGRMTISSWKMLNVNDSFDINDLQIHCVCILCVSASASHQSILIGASLCIRR